MQDLILATKNFAEYARLSNSVIFYYFDFTRTQPNSFNGWSQAKAVSFEAPDLFYHGGIMKGSGSYINGRMVVRPAVTYDEIVAEYVEQRNPSAREYAVFKSIDLKTQARIETSANPENFQIIFNPSPNFRWRCHESSFGLRFSSVTNQTQLNTILMTVAFLAEARGVYAPTT